MLLQTGSEHVRFSSRDQWPGPAEISIAVPETLILDGQQRLTSLYWALKGRIAVETKDAKRKSIRVWYFIDMDAAIRPEADREDAVLSVPEDGMVKAFGGDIRLDVATLERQYEQALFPVNRIFDSNEWRHAYQKHWSYDPEKIRLFDDFSDEVIERFKQYQVPVIELKRETPKEAVCLTAIYLR